MPSRLDLQAVFEQILGSPNVYFQPPESTKMDYPAIVYGLNKIENTFANGGVYLSERKYRVTVIDEDPDSAKNAILSVGDSILGGIKGFFGIKSPSRLMRDEVGHYVVDGIAEGITEDTSAEEAATKKAQNIVSAFKTELDKFSLDTSTTDLEYQLWEKLNGATATEAEKSAAQMGLLSNKLMIQTDKVALAQGEYQATLETFGSTSEEAQEAYNKYLQSQIDLAELANQLSEARSVETQRQKEAESKYYEYMRENTDDLLGMGLTFEQIQKAAIAESGYDPNAITDSMSVDVQGAVTSAMGTVQTAYASQSQQTFGGLVTDFSGWGMSYAGALGEGLQNGTPKALEAAKTLVQTTANSITAQKITWQTAGVNLVDGFVVGINSQVQVAAQAAAAMAAAALAAAKATFQINSPSKAFAELGKYADMGLAKGLTSYANVASTAASDVGKGAIYGLTATIGKISDALDGNMELQPTIRPVLDMTDIKNGRKQLGGLLNVGGGIHVSGVAARANAAATSGAKTETAASVPIRKSEEPNYSFTQNNYSPKALSRLDIYRQTKNQFSALKGAVTG